MLLHVRSSLESKEIDHWVVYLRTEGSSVFLLDAEGGVDVWSTGELATRWRGGAVVPMDVAEAMEARSFWQRVPAYWVGCGALIAGLLLWRGVAMRFKAPPRTVRRGLAAGMGIAASTCVLGFALGMTTSGGLLSSPEVVRRVQDASIGTFIARIDQSQMRRWLSEADVLIIDTRSPADYSRGHIEGAINLPVYLSEQDLGAAMRELGNDRRIVLYCLSERCSYANEVAGRLWRLGYQNLAVYEKGWRDWSGQK